MSAVSGDLVSIRAQDLQIFAEAVCERDRLAHENGELRKRIEHLEHHARCAQMKLVEALEGSWRS